MTQAAASFFAGRSIKTAFFLTALMGAKAIAGFVSQLVIVYEFGAGSWTDAFFLSMSIPQIVGDFLLGGAFLYAIVPLSFDVRERSGPKAQAYFHLRAFCLGWIISAALAAGFYFSAPYLIPQLGRGLTQDAMQHAVFMARLFSPLIIFSTLSLLGTGLFWVYKRYYESATVGLMYSLTVIIFCLFLKDWMGDFRLSFGVFTGSLAQTVLTVVLLSKAGVFSFSRAEPFLQDIGKLLKLMAPAMLSSLVVAVLPLQERYLASYLGKGAISCWDYSNALAAIPPLLVFNAVNTLFYSKMSEYVAGNQTSGSTVLLGRVLYFILLVTIPLSFFVILLERPILVLLLQRGAFTALEVERTRGVLAFIFMGLFAQITSQLLNRSYYAEKRPWVNLKANLCSLGVMLILNPLLAALLGLKGLGLATAAGAIAQMSFFLRQRSKDIIQLAPKKFVHMGLKILWKSMWAGIPVAFLAYGVFPKILLMSAFLKGVFILFALLVGFSFFALGMLWRRDEDLAGLLRFIFARGEARKDAPPSHEQPPQPGAGNKIRVVLVLDDVMVGGSERALLHWLTVVDRSRFHFRLVTLFGLGDLADAFVKQGFEIEHLDLKNKGYWRAFQNAKQLVARENPDIVFCLREGARAIGPVVFRILGVRGIAVRWGGVELKRSYRLYVLEHLQVNFIDAFHAVGRAVADLLRREYGTERTEVIYAGVEEPGQWTPQERKNSSTLQIISIGNLKWEKRHLDQIKIASRLKREGISFHLTIVGEGGLRKKIEHEILARGLTDCVTLAGKRFDIPQLLNQSDVFLFTSVSEGFPNAVLEAMAAGLPCVVYELPFVEEVDPDRKWLKVIPSGDVEAAAGVLAQLSAGPKVDEIKRDAERKELLQKFGVHEKVKQWEEALVCLAQRDRTEPLPSAS